MILYQYKAPCKSIIELGINEVISKRGRGIDNLYVLFFFPAINKKL